MATHERAADRGTRSGKRAIAALGEEIRRARVSAGLSQKAVGRAAGLSYSTIGRIERGIAPRISVVALARVAAVVGLAVSLRAYPSGSPLRDAGHLRLLDRLRREIAPSYHWRTEVPLPNPGDLRAWDAVARGPVTIAFEVETPVRDWQELERRIASKRRDGMVDRVILVLLDSRSNRAFLRDQAHAVRASFPIAGRRALRALNAGQDPGGDAVLLL